MSEKLKKNMKISDMIAKEELSSLKGMLSEYEREMEKMRAALSKAGASKKNTSKKAAGKSVKKAAAKPAEKSPKKSK